MIFPWWLCREILKLFLVVLLRIVFRFYEGNFLEAWDCPCTVSQVFRHLGESWAVSCNGMVMGEVVKGLRSGVSKTPTRGRGSVLCFVSQRKGNLCCSI